MLKRIRLGSGLVLFVFVATHLVNHAWGLASLEALAAARDVFVAVWRSWPGTVALYGALLAHFAVVLWSLYERRTLRLKPAELAQVALGVAIPLLLVQHVLGTRGLHEIFGTVDDYTYEILVLWVFTPENGMIQMVLLAVTWGHGCLGLHFWIKLRRWYRPAAPWLLAFAVILPLAAAAGFVAAGREIAALARADPFWLEDAVAALNWPGAEALAWYETWRFRGWVVLGGILALVMLARYMRLAIGRRRGMVRLAYGGGRIVEIRPPTTVLEASREAGIPHASICGGRGRCSTCRVRVGAGAEHLEQRARKRRGCCGGRACPSASASPASCARPATWRLRPSCSPTWTRARCSAAPTAGRASARWPSSSPTSAPSRASPRRSSPMTWSSCSTATSAPWGRRC